MPPISRPKCNSDDWSSYKQRVGYVCGANTTTFWFQRYPDGASEDVKRCIRTQTFFCFLMNTAAEYCTVICGDSGFIISVPVSYLQQFICITNYCVQRCFCFRMNTACLSAYNYVYVPEHLHYIFSQDLVWLVGLIVC